jgi:hypothetical protein
MHVLTPDAEVREYVARRIRVDVDTLDRQKILRRAVRIHRRNRSLYFAVMSGRVGA